MNTTYIQNNYYGSSGGLNSYMPYSGGFNNSFYGGSVFSMPSFGCGCMPSYPMFGGFCMPSYPSYPQFGLFSMPWGGGCCGGNRFFDMMMSMNLFQSMMNSLSKISSNLSSYSFTRTPSATNTNPRSNYRYTPTISSSKSIKNFNINTKTNLPQLKDIGYSSKKGKKLAQTALSNSVGFTGYCAKYVRMALEQTGLSNGLRADAADYNTVLSMNKNFKEISANGINLNSLPAGCILVYDRGQSGYSSKYGHVEITTGSGQAVSDGITTNIKPGARIYVPV